MIRTRSPFANSECEGCGEKVGRHAYILSGHLYCGRCGRQPWYVINHEHEFTADREAIRGSR